ncbi:Translation initiation factor IF-2, mitochondrial [Desmophyllum pertusum]|uniref:Translation initiation factor IF-2, mitochondrial n=1 Tax=Desmophyllum pertusum TaxID=174260 RepID=A0A9W9YUQ4_9CNID|nr:Translation initiation factor IF-2, mitochondrial [Desmophyllum pertusum]
MEVASFFLLLHTRRRRKKISPFGRLLKGLVAQNFVKQVVHCFCRGYSVQFSRPVITGARKFIGKDCKHYDPSTKLKFLSYTRTAVEIRWQHTMPPSHEPQASVVITPEMTIRQLATVMNVDPGTLADMLLDLGEELPNGLFTVLSPDLAELLVLEHKMTPVYSDIKETERSSLLPRPPVVTIMGHVDHGKTTLLDTLRRTSVAAGEAGGITQHIGAFSVYVPGADKTITFIDTPGHAAFETMRARGANVTDIVVLVVAVDEGVKRQTVESIKHAIKARVPIIVALNKVDKPQVNVEQTKQQLLQHGVQLEEFGGDIQAVEVSALKGTNFEGLLEAITTLAELHDLKARKNCPVQGIVLESRKDKGKGSIATVLIKSGTLKKGKIILANQAFAKVRFMFDDRGKDVSEAMPSTPVEVVGWRDLPSAGDEVIEVKSEQEAQDAANKKKAVLREIKMSSDDLHNSLLDVQLTYKGDPVPKQPNSTYDSSDKLNVIIRGDVDGSIEAINDALKTYKSKKVKLNVLSSEVGGISENDIRLADTFKAMVFGFNVNISNQVQYFAKRREVSVKHHKIIYKLLEDIKLELSNKMDPIQEETITGEAAVLKVFTLSGARKATVAGCRVKTGSLARNSLYRIIRNNDVIFEGNLSTMKRGVDDISQAKRETECGLSFEKFTDIQEGDLVQCCTVTVKEQVIDWDWGF